MENEFQPSSIKESSRSNINRNVNNVSHPPLKFNNVDVGQIRFEKQLGMFLDLKLSFN